MAAPLIALALVGAATCAPPGFESALRISDRKVIASYVEEIHFPPQRRAAIRWWPMSEQDPRVQALRYSGAEALVDLFIDAGGSVKAVCLERGEERLMPFIERPALALRFDRLNRGVPVVVPVRFEFNWPSKMFRESVYVSGPRLEVVAP